MVYIKVSSTCMGRKGEKTFVHCLSMENICKKARSCNQRLRLYSSFESMEEGNKG